MIDHLSRLTTLRMPPRLAMPNYDSINMLIIISAVGGDASATGASFRNMGIRNLVMGKIDSIR